MSTRNMPVIELSTFQMENKTFGYWYCSLINIMNNNILINNWVLQQKYAIFEMFRYNLENKYKAY